MFDVTTTASVELTRLISFKLNLLNFLKIIFYIKST